MISINTPTAKIAAFVTASLLIAATYHIGWKKIAKPAIEKHYAEEDQKEKSTRTYPATEARTAKSETKTTRL